MKEALAETDVELVAAAAAAAVVDVAVAVGGGSQPLDSSSDDISSRIIESGTRLPDCIAASALRPIAREKKEH